MKWFGDSYSKMDYCKGRYTICSQLFWVILVAILQIIASQDNQDNPGFLEYSVAEKQANAFVGSISAYLYTKADYDQATIMTFKYRMTPGPNQEEDAKLFQIDPDTGEITTSVAIDREDSCTGLVLCYMYIDIAISEPLQYFQVMTTKIEILDVNDNPPEFKEPTVELVFSESANIGSSRILMPATDPDSPVFGVHSYKLLPNDTELGLISPEEEGSGGHLRLYVRSELDREKKAQYSFKIYAYDGGIPSLSDTLDLQVTIEDTNDNPPEFTQNDYQAILKEDWPLDEPFVQVEATDRDEGINGQVTYSLSPSSENAYGKTFGINPDSGELYLKTYLDYEDRITYDLVVIAKDGSTDSNEVEVTVAIKVEDVNDNVPQVIVNTLTSSKQAKIEENSPTDIFVAYVSVFDGDSGENGETDCVLPDPAFSLQPSNSQYKILTNDRFDREAQDTYTLIIQCVDKGTPSLKGVQNFTVIIEDVNDNPPVFDQPKYVLNIFENNPIGGLLFHAHASDKDIDLNGEIRYSVTDGAVSQFVQIDSITGEIKGRIALDYEMMKSLSFEVVAVDEGSPPLTGSAVVTINLVDTNDEAPVFNKLVYTFDIPENEPFPGTVGFVSAVDLDSAPFNEVVYSLQTDQGQDKFKIDPITGFISTVSSLDREAYEYFSMYVIAMDKEDSSLRNSATVVINVLDRNDHAPHMVFPSQNNNTVRISNEVPIGFVVCYVTARDADIVENARLSFSIYDDSGNKHKGLFVVDSTTGAIMTTSEIVEYDDTLAKLSVVVQDHGSPVQTATNSLTIYIDSSVDYLNDNTELVERGNLTTIIAVSTVSAIIVVILAMIILVIKLRDSRHLFKAQTLMPHYKVESQTGEHKKYDGMNGEITHVYTVETDQNQPKNLYQVSNLPNLERPDHGDMPKLQPCTIISDHGLLYDKRLERKPLDDTKDADIDTSSSTDVSNADSGRGPSVDDEPSILRREMMAKDIPDLIQRRDLKTINLSMESNASQISNCHLQHSPRSLDKLRGGQPPSYESFLRKKSQKGEKPTKHIHFADETPGGDLNCEGGVTKNICDVESGRNNMVDYYHARDRGRVQRCESYKTRNNCKDLTDQSPGDTYHARQTSEPSKVYDLSNTVTSVMV